MLFSSTDLQHGSKLAILKINLRFGKILTINPFSYFIAVFRRAFYDEHFDIIVNGAGSQCLELKLSAYFQNTDAGIEFPKNVFQIIMG